MKIWMKLLLGILLGVLVGIFLPDVMESGLFFVETLIVQIGRFLLFPIILFGVTIGVYELKKEGMTLNISLRLAGYIALFSIILVLIGTFAILLLVPDRIPIITQRIDSAPVLSFGEYLQKLFPSNSFTIITESGNILLPLIVFSIFLGVNLGFDRIITRPVIQLFDSFSRTLFHMSHLIYEVIGVGFIALSAALVSRIFQVQDFSIYIQLFVILGITSLVVIFGIIPAILYFLGDRSNPYTYIFAALGAVLTGAISGDAFMSLSAAVLHAKKNLGIPRRINAFTLPLTALFAKPGTGLVSSVSFILILKSYSSLGVSFLDVLWIIAFAFLLSFFSSTAPRMSVFVSLSTMCALFGRGVEEGFLILNPVLPLLICIAVMIDTLSGLIISKLIAINLHVDEKVKMKDFI